MIGEIGRRVAVDHNRRLVFAHDEAVADEIVERLRQARDLGSGPVPRRDHLVLLALHDGARGRLGEEGERLRHHEAEPGLEQGVPEAGARRGRVLLDREDAAEPFSRGIPQLQRLASEDRADSVGGGAEMAENQRGGGTPSCEDQGHDLERLGEPKPSPLEEPQPPGRIAVEILGEVTAGLFQPTDLGRHQLSIIAPRLTQPSHKGGGAVCAVSSGMQDEDNEQLVDPEAAARHLGLVVGGQSGGEGRPVSLGGRGSDLPADDMVPDGEPVVCEIAPSLVQLDVPVVEIAGVGRLKACATDLKHHHQGAAVEGDDMVVQMPGIGKLGADLGFSSQAGGGDAVVSHG